MTDTLDRTSALDDKEDEYVFWLPRHRRAPGAARRQLRAFLGRTAGGEQYADVAELLLSELVTNAVEHARVPSGRLIKVRFCVTGGRLRAEVHDASPQRPVVRPRAAADEEAGRGLLLVGALSARWGCCPRAGGVGKFVWFECAPADAPAERGAPV
ncbi:ATP-binding protein [Kitasatospora sp. NPDC057223]|uniref:ATP-binding protein n=1 Tax=Kitasatospora sp. NPDC057223 TaxID=3346055 RepID=UPI00363A1C99